MDGSGQQGSGDDNSFTSRRKGRGPTHMRHLALRDESTQPMRITVEFDDDLKPIGKDGAQFTSYVGYLARSKISIDIPSWKKVDKDLKKNLWEDILLTFDIPATKQMRDLLLKQIAERWRDFKSTLTKHYINGKRKDEHPKERYSFISEEVWENFVKQREDPAFQTLSQKNKQISEQNVYQHTMSRAGYGGLERSMMEERLKNAQMAVASDPTGYMPPIERPSRQEKWKAARIKKGQYITPQSAAVAERIDTLEEQLSQGTFIPQGRMDILATAIGKADHPGRVRETPKGIGIKEFFGSASRRSTRSSSANMVSKEELDQRLQEETERVRAELSQQHMVEMQKIRDEFDAKFQQTLMMMGTSGFQMPRVSEPSQGSPVIKSGKGSNNQTQPLTVSDLDPSPDPIEDNGMPCSLYVDYENSPVHVASGRAFMGTTIHGNKIPSNQARVTVERIVRGQGGTPVPNPTDEVRLLAQAKGHFILWPKRLIAKPMVRKAAAKKAITSASSDPVLLPLPGDVVLMYSSLEVLHSMVPNMVKPVTFKMPLGVVGSDITYDFTIDKRDLVQFLNFEELDIAFMQLAILHFNQICRNGGLEGTYGFMCPQRVQKEFNTVEARSIYIMTTMTQTRKLIYFAPYVEGYHWTLIVYAPFDNKVYWFDSLCGSPSEETKDVIDTAFHTFNVVAIKQNRQAPTWILPKYRCQQGHVECGYYVICYMNDIIETGTTEKLDEIFQNTAPYLMDDINLMRDTLSTTLVEKIEI